MIGFIERKITLELCGTGVQARVRARQGDSLIHKIIVDFTRYGKACFPDGVVFAEVRGVLPTGKVISADVQIENGKRCVFIPGSEFFVCGGSVVCSLILRGDDGGELCSPAFAIDAEPSSAAMDDVADGELYSRIAELLAQVIAEKKSLGDGFDEKLSELEDKLTEIYKNGGFDGRVGSRWFHGTANLNGAVFVDTIKGAVEGDWYLNTDTYNIYEASGDFWGYRGNIKGKAFTYDDFTEEQLAALKGEKGDTLTVKQTTHSYEDGGINSIIFGDGTEIWIRNGKTGGKGDPGYTPVKGTDYWTETDKEEFKTDLGIFTDVSANSASANLFDNEWEYGYFNDDGTEQNDLTPITVSYRSKNYIAVKGGERLSQNNNQDAGYAVIQYDENKNMVVGITNFARENNRWTNNGITLNSDTRYIRLCRYATVADLSTVQMNVFYHSDINGMFADPGDVFVYVPRYIPGETGEFINPQKIKSPLTAKKIVYDGDSICIGTYGGGGYAKIIADMVSGTYVNNAVGGGRLTANGGSGGYHSVVDNLGNLPADGDLYCFEGGVNDVWSTVPLGTYSMSDYTGALDTTTICGALEAIFRYCLTNFVGKPVCFVISHKVSNISFENYKNYHDAAVAICNKYSIPYYDAYNESGLNGWNTAQNNTFLTGNANGTPDGCHPNEDGYKRYYVPQLIQLFEKIMCR